MTDDESRKAFEARIMTAFSAANNVIVLAIEDGEYTFSDMQTQWEDWQAAVEWATKRERENIDTEAIAWAYAKLRNFGVLDNTMDNAMMADRLMAMLQEPKP